MAYSDKEVQAYIDKLRASGLSGAELDKAIYDAAKQYDVSAEQVMRTIDPVATDPKKTAYEWIMNEGLSKDWATELVSRNTDQDNINAFNLAKSSGLNMSDAIDIVRASDPNATAGNAAYTVDSFGRNQNLGWLNVGDTLFGKTGDDFNFPYNDRMLGDLHGGMFGDAAIPDMEFYANRYGMGSDDLASYLTAHTGQTFTPDQIDQYMFENDMSTLVGSEGFTPTPTGASPQDYAAYDKKKGENLTDYYSRLQGGRAGGILGTRDMVGGMFPGGTSTVANEQMTIKGMFEEYFPK